MNPLQQYLEQYLKEAMGLHVSPAPSSKPVPIPHFLAQLYEPRPLMVDGQLWLGVFLREGEDLKPATFEKHVRQLPWGEATGYFLVAKALPSYVRSRLVERRIPFVIPGRQVYLPQWRMALHPHQAEERLVHIDKMSPATQLVVILALNNRLDGVVSPQRLAGQTLYTKMTMTRVWNELEALGLGAQTREGKQRLLSFPEGRKALWEKARPLMRDPVQERILILGNDVPLHLRLLAGESALAGQSSLVPPSVLVYAMSREDWRRLEQNGVQRVPWEEPGTCLVQVWRYTPQLADMPWHVDPFSLYLSLQDEPDERVQLALEEMMEQYPW
ncbi:MAG: hypothetical protein Q8J78_17680 [Moraxellaceae bacterium]|nr:hypothetical protein [Moraxellaceae bacterium]